jgi:hypothetical protein
MEWKHIEPYEPSINTTLDLMDDSITRKDWSSEEYIFFTNTYIRIFYILEQSDFSENVQRPCQ